MKHLLVLLLIAVPGLAPAQGLLDFRRDLAFEAGAIEAIAERAYRARLQTLAAADQLDTDTALLRRLRDLLARLQPAARRERPEAAAMAWELHTCSRCGENASAMAGGKLLVGEEFVTALAFSDDELAYLLAHEMGHVLAEHTREFATTARFFLGNGRNRDYWDIQNELDESIAENLRMAPLFAQQELEADYIGFVLGARSGFDPEAMPRMLRKLHPATPLEPELAPAFSFHPAAGDRQQRAQAMLETARRIRALGTK
jgi:Zn-dependent protease with chaperone function